MTRPASPGLGWQLGEPLADAGRAARWSAVLDGGEVGELWRLPVSAEGAADRLVDLGRRGVGGFVARGADDAGIWLVRGSADPSLTRWMDERRGPVDGPLACAMIASLASAVAGCESAALFPGPIDPDHLVVRGAENAADVADTPCDPGGAGAVQGKRAVGLVIRADALVAAVVGGRLDRERTTASMSTRWLAPEQAAGHPPDAASNRYVIGLLLYRLLAGEHPFAGRGLRRGLDDQAERGAPPLPDAVAAALRPGLHSFCLRLLDPEPSRRPSSSAAIADHLRGLLAEEGDAAVTEGPAGRPEDARRDAAPGAETRPESAAREAARLEGASKEPSGSTAGVGAVVSRVRPAAARAEGAPPRRTGLVRVAVAAAPLVAAAVVVLWAARGLEAGSAAAPTGPRARLASARSVADCASCHPRQTAEWSRSVMGHAATSPLFQSLEILIEEQVGRDRDCPGGAGILRAAGADACRSSVSGLPITGSGGELWCVNCHAPGENLAASLPAWNGRGVDASTRRPLRDLLPAASLEGIGCAACHQAIGPSHPGNQLVGLYEGNPSWVSADTGRRFLMRPEDERGLHGIANSGYYLDPLALVSPAGELVRGGRHAVPRPEARRYLASSEFCGACHDVRLFGTDALGAQRGEHFKRLRNAYSEWADWSRAEVRAGRVPASCQDCHMSLFPGICAPAAPGEAAVPGGGAAGRACPPGTSFSPRAPGVYATGRTAAGSPPGRVTAHSFSGVDVPLANDFDPASIDDAAVDVFGVPIGARQRRDLLLARTFRLALEAPRRVGARLEVPVVLENVGAGHRVPAGFSQEREFWVHLVVRDAAGRTVYEVGRVDRGDQDLRDKVMLRVETSGDRRDRFGRPIGLFGADIADGPDVPLWQPPPELGGSRFRGRGLINFQNGFLRCVRCIGVIDGEGRCQAGPGQEGRRAARYIDGDYDLDSGRCVSNLSGPHAFLETYFPVGALDAERGLLKGPDAIIDTRSAPPGQSLHYTYDLEVAGPGPFTIEARLLFRAFPPFLLRAFIDYEAAQDRRGLRPSGPLIDPSALSRLDVVEIAAATAVVP